jgi:formimidoylglutamate deiminase
MTHAAEIHAARALLPGGWARDVRVRVGADGRIGAVETGVPAPPGSRRLLVPAPSNLHCHAFQRAMAGLAEGREEGRDGFWSWRAAMYRFLDRLTPDDVEAIAAMAYVEMAEAGFAAVAEFHYLHHAPDGRPYDDPAETAGRICAAAAATGLGLTLAPALYAHGGAGGRPTEPGQRRFACGPDLFDRLLDGAAAALRGLPADAGLAVAPHSLRACTPEQIARVRADHPALPLHVHAAEQPREVAEVLTAHGRRPVETLLDLGAGPGWTLIHATHMTDAETRALARSGAVAGLCPITESNLGDGIFPAVAFRDAGGRFGVGSDSCVRIALAEELRTLEYAQRLRDGTRCALAGADGSTGTALLTAAADGGAAALGRDAGVIRVGAWADLAALDADALCFAGLPSDRALDGWIFAGDDRAVREVWAAGRAIVREGRHVARTAVEAAYRAAMARLTA